jgi:hypothetical protein
MRLGCLFRRHRYDIPGGIGAWIIRTKRHRGSHKARCIWCGATHYAVQRRRGRRPLWRAFVMAGMAGLVAAGLAFGWRT